MVQRGFKYAFFSSESMEVWVSTLKVNIDLSDRNTYMTIQIYE